MQVQRISNNNYNTSFGIKHTYLYRSKNSITKLERDYFKSLHKEAMARRTYLDFNKAEFDLMNYGGSNSLKDTWNKIKLFSKITGKKLLSVIYEDEAYRAFPNRFVEPDIKSSEPWRYYQLKSFSGDALPSQIKRY